MPKLTKELLESWPESRPVYYFDSNLSGFGAKVYPSGVVSFFAQYRPRPKSSTRRVTLGRYGALTLEQAREKAKQLLDRIDLGKATDLVDEDQSQTVTIAELAARYLAEHAEPRKTPASVTEDRRMLDKVIIPALGGWTLRAVRRTQVSNLHSSLGATPYQANRVLALLSKMFTLAEVWGLRAEGSNPARRVKRFEEQNRDRFLSEAELTKLGGALASEEAEANALPREHQRRQQTRLDAVAVIRLLIFTGCRLGEILSLRWEYLAAEQRCLRLPKAKRGAKIVVLNAPALAVFDPLPHQASGWIFPGERGRGHREDVRNVWNSVRRRAKLQGLRIHDLRHSLASTS